jgi:hypothetical protein
LQHSICFGSSKMLLLLAGPILNLYFNLPSLKRTLLPKQGQIQTFCSFII